MCRLDHTEVCMREYSPAARSVSRLGYFVAFAGDYLTQPFLYKSTTTDLLL